MEWRHPRAKSDRPRGVERIDKVPHIPQRATIMADEVQGVREFGSESMATPDSDPPSIGAWKKIAPPDRLHHRGTNRPLALAGRHMDNGSTQSTSTAAGRLCDSVDWDARHQHHQDSREVDAIGHVEDGLGSAPYTEPHAICLAWVFGRSRSRTPRWKKPLSANGRRPACRVDRCVPVRRDHLPPLPRRRSAVVTSGKTFPVTGVPDTCTSAASAPANYAETVKPIGLPYYAKSRMLWTSTRAWIVRRSQRAEHRHPSDRPVELTTSN